MSVSDRNSNPHDSLQLERDQFDADLLWKATGLTRIEVSDLSLDVRYKRVGSRLPLAFLAAQRTLDQLMLL